MPFNNSRTSNDGRSSIYAVQATMPPNSLRLRASARTMFFTQSPQSFAEAQGTKKWLKSLQVHTQIAFRLENVGLIIPANSKGAVSAVKGGVGRKIPTLQQSAYFCHYDPFNTPFIRNPILTSQTQNLFRSRSWHQDQALMHLRLGGRPLPLL